MKCKYLLTGHSRKQYIQRNGDKTIINPSSVGIPQGASRNPKYTILQTENGDVYSEEAWKTVAIELGMKLTEQEIMTLFRDNNALK